MYRLKPLQQNIKQQFSYIMSLLILFRKERGNVKEKMSENIKSRPSISSKLSKFCTQHNSFSSATNFTWQALLFMILTIIFILPQ